MGTVGESKSKESIACLDDDDDVYMFLELILGYMAGAFLLKNIWVLFNWPTIVSSFNKINTLTSISTVEARIQNPKLNTLFPSLQICHQIREYLAMSLGYS